MIMFWQGLALAHASRVHQLCSVKAIEVEGAVIKLRILTVLYMHKYFTELELDGSCTELELEMVAIPQNTEYREDTDPHHGCQQEPFESDQNTPLNVL